jgi:hypothetical protein
MGHLSGYPIYREGDIVISMRRAYRVLGPPEPKPLAAYEDADPTKPVIEDRLALPVEDIPPRANAPEGGCWLDESCFDGMEHYRKVEAA